MRTPTIIPAIVPALASLFFSDPSALISTLSVLVSDKVIKGSIVLRESKRMKTSVVHTENYVFSPSLGVISPEVASPEVLITLDDIVLSNVISVAVDCIEDCIVDTLMDPVGAETDEFGS